MLADGFVFPCNRRSIGDLRSGSIVIRGSVFRVASIESGSFFMEKFTPMKEEELPWVFGIYNNYIFKIKIYSSWPRVKIILLRVG